MSRNLTKNELFNMAKDKLGLVSDNQLALELGIDRQLIHIHRKNEAMAFRDQTLERLAGILNMDLKIIKTVSLKAKIKKIQDSVYYVKWLLAHRLQGNSPRL